MNAFFATMVILGFRPGTILPAASLSSAGTCPKASTASGVMALAAVTSTRRKALAQSAKPIEKLCARAS
jgi:hypothetical protein